MGKRSFIPVFFLVIILNYTSGTDLLEELENLKSETRRDGGSGQGCCGCQSSGADGRMDRLETLMSLILLKSDVGDVKEDQSNLKKHLLNRLHALEEKTEWCFTAGRQGNHPLYTQLTQIKQALADLNKDYRPSNGTAKVPHVHINCQAAYDEGWTKSGIFRISPDSNTEMDVYCEQELHGGGWTVFQRRRDGSVDFYRNWDDYKSGFGNLDGEFWLGNDNIHLLTNNHDQKMKIELVSPGGEFAYADYSSFWIDDESKKYASHASGFSGAIPPGNSFHNGKFSTKDQDNDSHALSCANMYYGGWWYTACHSSNLNGLYGNTTYAKGLSWRTWTGYHLSMTATKMMIKDISPN